MSNYKDTQMSDYQDIKAGQEVEMADGSSSFWYTVNTIKNNRASISFGSSGIYADTVKVDRLKLRKPRVYSSLDGFI